MPSFYQNSLTKSNPRRAKYAREAVFEEFRSRDARALDYDDFVDRAPHQRPTRIRDFARRP
jgi:hypothetical protein